MDREECGAPLARGNCNLPFGHTEEHGWSVPDFGAHYIQYGGCLLPVVLVILVVVAIL